MPESDSPVIEFRLLSSETELDACARMMSQTDPWLALGRGFDACRRDVAERPGRESWIAIDPASGDVTGIVVVNLSGAFTGYIQTLCVDSGSRGKGVGTALVHHAENRIFAVSPNVFLCVSSFNPDARRLYERLGYEYIGELRDYLIRGASELLYRKTIGPLTEFVRPSAAEPR